MQEMAKVVHKDYEKISDNVMWLGTSFALKFNVVLNRYTDKHGRENYHKEILYYKGKQPCINITRTFDSYLSVECWSDKDKVFLYIRQQDIYFLKYALKQACEWFTSEQYKDMFMKKEGRIYAAIRVDPVRITTYGGYLEFIPSIVTYGSNQEQQIGVTIYMNSDENSTFMNVSQLLSFRYFIDTFNMYQSAITLLNYLQRPELGTNLVDTGFIQESNYREDKSGISFKKNAGHSSNSFFDKIKASKREE